MPRYIDVECDCVKEIINRRAFNSREDIQDFLDNIPTADVAPVKHGYWIEIGDYAFKCTSCGKMYWESKGYAARTHFCPNCGTRMDGDVKWR